MNQVGMASCAAGGESLGLTATGNLFDGRLLIDCSDNTTDSWFISKKEGMNGIRSRRNYIIR
jgi:hypothetical protein